MQTTNSNKVLFPEEIISCEGVLGVIAAIRHPQRIHAKGIDCITGFSVMFEAVGSKSFWLPVKVKPEEWDILNGTLNVMPTLAYPLTGEIIHEFLDDYVLRNYNTKFIPTFLSSRTLHWDVEQRVGLYKFELEELSRLFLLSKLELIDKSRFILDEKKQAHLLGQPNTVFFTREEAVRYLERKSYLQKALEFSVSWHEIVRESDILDSVVNVKGCCFGYPKMLEDSGVEHYRNWLRLQRPLKRKGEILDLSSSKLGESCSASLGDINVAQSSSNAQEVLVSEASSVYPETFDLNITQRAVKTNSRNDQLMHSSVADPDKCAISSAQTEHSALPQSSKEKDMTLIGMDVVCKLTGYERSTIFNYESPKGKYFDSTFPKSQIIKGVKKWYKSEIEEWIILHMKRKPSS